MPKRGRRRKKTRTHVVSTAQNEAAAPINKGVDNEHQQQRKVPKSLVIRRGKTATEVGELVHDLRTLMLPYTALHFQEGDPQNRKLTLAQYTHHLALPLGITHILAFSQNHDKINLLLARTPQGPTLSFRVHQFSLNRHVQALQKRPISSKTLGQHPPVVVTNNFGSNSETTAPHVKLMRITFQNLFSAINVSTVKLVDCRRVVLFHLIENNEEQEQDQDGKQPQQQQQQQLVQMRHYAIQATPVGVSRRVRRLVSTSKNNNKKLPNLHNCQDIADYIIQQQQTDSASAVASDSEPEDDPAHVVQLPDHYVGTGNTKAQKSALKLVELGPRLTLELVKVEKGLGSGDSDVLYHAHVQKSPQEAAALKAAKEQERLLKQERRATQDANVERKRNAIEEKRLAKRKRREEREQQQQQQEQQASSEAAAAEAAEDNHSEEEEEEEE